MTDLITRARRAAGISGNDVAGNLLIELVDEIERLRRDMGMDRPTFVEVIPTEGMRRNAVFMRQHEPLHDRLDRIEAWLKATHGYPYPAKG